MSKPTYRRFTDEQIEKLKQIQSVKGTEYIFNAINNFDELVEACKSLVNYADNLDDNDNEPTDKEMEEFEKVYNKCKQALKNATEVKQ